MKSLATTVDEIARRPEQRVPFVVGLLGELDVHDLYQLLGVLHAQLHVGEPFIVDQVRTADGRHDRSPVAVRLKVHKLDPSPIGALVQVSQGVSRVLSVVGIDSPASGNEGHADTQPLQPHRGAEMGDIDLLADPLDVAGDQRGQHSLA